MRSGDIHQECLPLSVSSLDPQTLRREKRTVFITLLCLAAVYLSVAMNFSSLHAFWSPDCGARFAMIRNWVEHGNLIRWDYSSTDTDPSGRIHPLAYFLFHQPRSFCAMYEPLFPLLCGFMYRAFGFYGLPIIPALCGLITAAVTYATALRLRLRSRVLLPLIVGLATPLLIYSVVFWDHGPMMMLAALASCGMLRSLQEGRAQPAAWAGAALGLGIWVHELMLAVFIAAAAASLPLVWCPSGRRSVFGLVAGFLPLALLWAGANRVIYGNFGGPHLGANMGGNAADHPFSLSLVLDQQKFIDRAQEELTGIMSSGIMITNTHTDLFALFLVFAGLLILYFYATLGFGADWQFAPLLAFAAAGLACYLVRTVGWANGLFEATPLFIPALAVTWLAHRERKRPADHQKVSPTVVDPSTLFYAWMSRASFLYVLIIVVDPMLPGVDWGSRYLLPVLPFLFLLAVHALETQYRASKPRCRRGVVVSIIALVSISLYCQVQGLVSIRRNILYNREVNRRVRALTSPVIVVSNIGLGAELTAISLPQLQFMVRDGEDWQLFVIEMRRRKISDFTFIGSDVAVKSFTTIEDDTFTGKPLLSKHETQYFNVPSVTEDGGSLQFVRFGLGTQKPQK